MFWPQLKAVVGGFQASLGSTEPSEKGSANAVPFKWVSSARIFH